MSDQPAVTGKVVRRLGMQASWAYYELDKRGPMDLVWQVATKDELTVGDTVAAFGHVPAEAVVYADRVEVVERAA